MAKRETAGAKTSGTKSETKQPAETSAGGSAKAEVGTSVGNGIIEGEALEPIKMVERELTRPDGTTVMVQVPVYPPFRLKDRNAPRTAPPRGRKTPTLKRRKRAEGSQDA
ncbi:MAG: hypothetical protein AAF430_20285 [Myxococcota bacterium]